MDINVSLRDRGGKEQRIILRTMLPGLPSLVAVAENPDVNCALAEAKRELIRQLEHQKSAREPMHNRLRRTTIRHPRLKADRSSKVADVREVLRAARTVRSPQHGARVDRHPRGAETTGRRD